MRYKLGYTVGLIGTCFLMLLVVPPWFAGFIAGNIWTALKQGWKEGNDVIA